MCLTEAFHGEPRADSTKDRTNGADQDVREPMDLVLIVQTEVGAILIPVDLFQDVPQCRCHRPQLRQHEGGYRCRPSFASSKGIDEGKSCSDRDLARERDPETGNPMTSVSDLAVNIQQILNDLATQAAIQSGFSVRPSKLAGPNFPKILILAALETPQPALEDYAQMAAEFGIDVSAQAFHDRFDKSAAECMRLLLNRMLDRVIVGHAMPCDLLNRFQGVFIQDATYLRLPESLAERHPGRESGAALKLQVRVDLTEGTLKGLFEPAKTADQKTALTPQDLPEGSLLIRDLGYFDLADFVTMGSDRYWLSRYQANTAVFIATERIDGDLAGWLATKVQADGEVDEVVELGMDERLKARLVAWRVKPEVAARRRQKLIKRAREKGRLPSKVQLALCDWTVLIGNVPCEKASVWELGVLYRARWQIELVFRLWKKEGSWGVSRRSNFWRVETEIYAVLGACLLAHWIRVVTVGADLHGSAWRAMRAIRVKAGSLAEALEDTAKLASVIRRMDRRIQRAGRIEKRKTKHPTWQLLQDPSQFKLSVA